jgi:thymidylate synthase
MKAFETECFVEGFQKISQYLVANGTRKSDMMECQDIVLKVCFDNNALDRLTQFISNISKIADYTKGFEKAKRAYLREKGNITKPSYIGRMKNFSFLKPGSNSFDGINQISRFGEKFAEAPQASNFTISVFHPDDLVDGFRPGYVPCLSFIDVKYRAGHFTSKFFFRSCDIAEVGAFDLFYCSNLHRQLIKEALDRRPDVQLVQESCIFYFSRAFYYKRKIPAFQTLINQSIAVNG